MKFLLAACNAKYIHSNLAVYSLRAYAQKYSRDIIIREYTINQLMDDVLRDIYETGADVICFSCYIWNISYVEELLENLSKVLPGAKFWVGGPEVSFDGEAFLEKHPFVTGVMVGEGEATFLDLAEYYETGEGSLKDIPGIIWREERDICSCIHHNGWREALDLSSIPFPWDEDQDFSHRLAYYESSRGCPFSCSYCLSSVDKRLRFRRLDLVERELQFFLDRKVARVKFVDRTFNCRPDHAMAIWRYIRDHDNGTTNFHFEISADLLNEEELELLSTLRPGLVQLEIGVQSVNPRTIQAIRRTMDLKRLTENVARIRSFRNIHQHLDLIAGLPYEDLESFQRSFCAVYAMEPDQLQLGFLKVLKGSCMMEEAPEYGIVWKSREPYEVLSTNWLDFRQILRLKTVEHMVEIYYNSRQFSVTLEGLLPYFPDPFAFYEELGEFYRKQGYEEVSHSRIRRYEILLEFALTVKGVSRESVVEDMLFDLYLRENLKSRPSFAPSQKPWEQDIREYRRKHGIPKTAHIEVFGEDRAVLFDYEHRDPLTYNAAARGILLYDEGEAD